MTTEAQVVISPIFKGQLTISDLLTSGGTMFFWIKEAIFKDGGCVFQIIHDDFVFCLSVQQRRLVLQRNDSLLVLPLPEISDANQKVVLHAIWAYDKLKLGYSIKSAKDNIEISTRPTAPPAKLINWARKNNLIQKEKFNSEEEFREKVYSCLQSINQKIHEADAYKSFWNITYNGNEIVSRIPKKEVEVQPLIQCLLSDQMLLSNIEVVPEHHSGAGDLDFMFLAYIPGVGIKKLCAEFKLAHSKDLENGLWRQLPDYMKAVQSTYGAYCVLDYRCEWFDKPKLIDKPALDLYLTLMPEEVCVPEHNDIRCFIINLGKPSTASKNSS